VTFSLLFYYCDLFGKAYIKKKWISWSEK